MWISPQDYAGGSGRFFRVSFSDNSLKQYYTTNFTLMYHHKMDIETLDRLMPWERELYIGMMIDEVKNENFKLQMAAAQRHSKGK